MYCMVWYVVWLYVFDAHYVSMHMVEEKALGDCRVWKLIQSEYGINKKVEVRINEGQVSILYFIFIMHVIYDSSI